jgi:hydroxymethylpyrimidine/phosphomethylpyrimidine kinase
MTIDYPSDKKDKKYNENKSKQFHDGILKKILIKGGETENKAEEKVSSDKKSMQEILRFRLSNKYMRKNSVNQVLKKDTAKLDYNAV